MGWTGFTYDHKIALKVIEGNMNAAKYREEILRDVIVPIQEAHLAENFILLDDNTTSHRARIVTAYKQVNNITTVDWPARYPDLNVIEHA